MRRAAPTPCSLPVLLLALIAGGAFTWGACDSDPGRLTQFASRRTPIADGVIWGSAADTRGSDGDTFVAPPDTGPRDSSSSDGQHPDGALPDTQVPDDSVENDSTSDTVGAPDAGPDATVLPVPEGPADLNRGFIGGACDGVASCDFTGSRCLDVGAGWPGGTCTKACTSTCPDAAGMAVTFCVDGDAVDETGGVCLQKCDLGKSPSGCRAGYTCGDEHRLGTQDKSAWVCLPGTYRGCLQELIARGVSFTLPSLTTYEQTSNGKMCSIFEPIQLAGTVNGVRFRPSDFTKPVSNLYVQCGVALALYETAAVLKRYDVTDAVHYGTYNCRTIAGSSNLSQHAFANAIDIAGLQLSNGQRVTVLGDWERDNPDPQTPAGRLLFDLAQELHALHIWNVILTPEYNAAHYDHFHVDLTPGSWFLSE